METEQKCRQIAEALGWHLELVKVEHTKKPRYAVLDPQGRRHENRWIYPTMKEAWGDVPNFYASAEASMGLLEAMLGAGRWIVSIDFTAGHFEVACDSRDGPIVDGFAKVGRTLMEAIAEAFRASRGLTDEPPHIKGTDTEVSSLRGQLRTRGLKDE